MNDDSGVLPPCKQFQFSRRQHIVNLARRLSVHVMGFNHGSYRVRLSRTQSRKVFDVYVHLPPALREICPWNTFVDRRARKISPRRNEEIILTCKDFENPTWAQSDTIDNFVSMLDIMLDTKRDAVVDALIRMYPRLRDDVRSQIDLDVDIVACVQSGSLLKTKKRIHRISAITKLQIRGTSDIAASAAYTYFLDFIHVLNDYPGTDYLCARPQPYVYTPLYGS